MFQNLLKSNLFCITIILFIKIFIIYFLISNVSKIESSDPSFHFEFRGEIPMKGKPRPIKMWLLSRNKNVNLEHMKCPFSI